MKIKLNNIDDNIINRECRSSLKSYYEQIIMQPIEIHSYGQRNINKTYLAGVSSVFLVRNIFVTNE